MSMCRIIVMCPDRLSSMIMLSLMVAVVVRLVGVGGMNLNSVVVVG